MKIKLVVDSASDMENTDDVRVVPIKLTIDGVDYYDGVDINNERFYQMLVEEKKLPRTSQPNPNEYLKVFEELLDNDEYIICLTISSKLSGSYNSACLAKNMLESDHIFVIDSLSATLGMRLIADEILAVADRFDSFEDLCQEAIKIRDKASVIGVVDTLEYLALNGRLKKVTAKMGDLLHLKPVLVVENGVIELKEKCLGKTRSSKALINIMRNQNVDLDKRIYVLYSCGMENAQSLISELRKFHEASYPLYEVGPTIGAHLGPDVFGVAYFKK